MPWNLPETTSDYWRGIALRLDLEALAEEMPDAMHADVERELLRRIGGESALPGYVDVLLAGHRAKDSGTCDCGYRRWHDGMCQGLF